MSSQKKELKSAIEDLKLEQKVIEKTAINRMREIEKIKADIESIKEKKEKLMLEIVDLKQGKRLQTFLISTLDVNFIRI